MENQNDQSVKTGDWFLTLFLAGIPLVGIILLFVWAFGGGGVNPSKANWAKATLLWCAIGIFFAIIIIIVFGAIFSKYFLHAYGS
jgi:hypothetical protein